MRRGRGTIGRPSARAVRLAGIACLVWAVAACAPTLSPVQVRDGLVQTVTAVAGTPTPTSRALSATATRRVIRLTPTPQALPERVPTGEPGAITGEVPEDLLRAIVEDLATRLDVAADAITVVQAESVVWPDGSLGCPQPGFLYTQALVPGYQVVLQHGGQDYDYRVGERGYFFLCERSLLSPAGTPSKENRP
jgi:hypothetical protein